MATQVELSDRWFLSDVLNQALAWCEADAEASACQIERSMSRHQICTQEMLDMRVKRMKQAIVAYQVLKDAYFESFQHSE